MAGKTRIEVPCTVVGRKNDIVIYDLDFSKVPNLGLYKEEEKLKMTIN